LASVIIIARHDGIDPLLRERDDLITNSQRITGVQNLSYTPFNIRHALQTIFVTNHLDDAHALTAGVEGEFSYILGVIEILLTVTRFLSKHYQSRLGGVT